MLGFLLDFNFSVLYKRRQIMIIGRKSLMENVLCDLSDSLESILIVGGNKKSRISYLHNILMGLYPSPNHPITVFDTETDGDLKQIQPEDNYEILSYDKYFSTIITELSKRDRAFAEGRLNRDFPNRTYVFNNADDYLAEQLSNSKTSNIFPAAFSLFGDLKRLKVLGVRLVVVSGSLEIFSSKEQVDSFKTRFYLGGFNKEEESLLLGEPYYLSRGAGKLVYFHDGIASDLLGLPIKEDTPEWIIDELSSLNENPDDYIVFSKYQCLYCCEEVFTLSSYSCQRCGEDSLLSIAIGKIILDCINQHYKIITNISDLETVVRNEALAKADLISCFSFIKNKEEYSTAAFNRDFNHVFAFYYNEYQKIINRRKAVRNVFLKAVKITRLFGNESFVIDFKSEDNLSILYGTNAFGKTTILKILSSLLINKSDKENIANFQFLRSIPFDKVEIKFSNDSSLLVSQCLNNKSPSGLFIYYFYDSADDDDRLDINCDDNNMIEKINNHFSLLHRLVGDKKVMFVGTNRVLDASEVIRLIASRLSIKNTISFNDVSYANLKKIFDNHIRITAFKNIADFVYSKRLTLKRLISRVRSEIIDNNIYLRNSGAGVPITRETYNRVHELFDLGVLPTVDRNLIEDPKYLVLRSESNERLFMQGSPYPRRFYRRIIETIDALYEFNKKFLVFKELFEGFYDDFNPSKKTISLERGRIELKTSDNKKISLTSLSTGENNVVSILRTLIFDLPNNSILFIDEPEISLHIAWQVRLMEVIAEKMSNKKIQVIIATHSPYIGTYHEDSLAKVEVFNV